MNKILHPAALLSLSSLFLAACGGGHDYDAGINQFEAKAASGAVSAGRYHALAVAGLGSGSGGGAAVTITDELFFQWAQRALPTIFAGTPTSATLNVGGLNFNIRAYSNGNYLAVAGGRGYVLGPVTGNQLLDVGPIQAFETAVCSLVNCGGTTNPPPGGTGSLNECVEPASIALATGSRASLVYTYSGLIGGDQTVESVVDGASTFKGQSAVQVTTTTTGSNSFQGITTTTTTRSRSYAQAANNGLTRTLGAIIEATVSTALPSIPGLPPLPGTNTTTTSETVYNPPSENIEYTIAVGQSINKTESSTTTVTSGPGAGTAPITVSGTTTYTFEAKETITVPAGTFSTCRYRFSTPGDSTTSQSWLIVGKGIMAKSETRTSQGTQSIVLKSGTYNGSRL